MKKLINYISSIINNFRNLESNDKNILFFMLGFTLLVVQKPIELFSYLISWIIFLIGFLCVFGSMFKSYLEDKKDGQ
jgi:ABC-type antimicrobial peptide transport system permease subunit